MNAIILIAATSALVALALSGCGRRGELAFPKPAASGAVAAANPATPATPVGAKAPPKPGELIAPTPQERPARSDELLRQSEQRQSDEFDLPPS